jgi:uncharacterized protein YndB with AHSA1/START domain
VRTTYESIDGRPALRFERRIAHPVEAVWGAITEPAELEQWFPTTVAGEMRTGGKLAFTFAEHDLPAMAGTVTDYEPQTSLAFFWGEDHLRFELSPADGGAQTDLRLTVLLDSADKAARDGAGWHVCLDRLVASLDGSDERALKAVGEGWREHYDDYAGRGFPATAAIPEAAS